VAKDNRVNTNSEYHDDRDFSVLNLLIVQRLLAGLGSVLLIVLSVLALRESPITGAVETETLRWRFEVLNKLTDSSNSKDVEIVFLGEEMPDTGKQFEDSLASLIEKIERAKPAVVGIDLALGRIDSKHLKDVLKAFPNIILGVPDNSIAANGTDVAPDSTAALPESRRGSTRLYVEENGMVTQLPAGTGLFGKLPNEKTFCHIVASYYRAANNDPELTAESGPYHFINYKNLGFEELRSEAVGSKEFEPAVLRNKIVLIGNRDLAYTVPGVSPHIHKADRASEVLVQAFAIQTLIDESTIKPSPSLCFTLMLYTLALMGLLMPVWSHGVRSLVFATSLVTLFLGSCAAIIWAHIFIQIWPFLIGLVTSFIIGTVAYTITDLRARNRQLRQAQTELEKRGKEIARARESGMEQERKRIALDLHDDALKEIFLASTSVDKLLENGLEPTLGSQVQSKLHEASDKIRRIMANLSPSALDVCGLPGAIENLADDLGKETEIEVSMQSNVGSQLDSLDGNQALLIYRIVQEAFNNIQKHSKATKVSVDMNMQESNLDIAIADNGIGMNGSALRPNSYGLDNMKYRAELIGAAISWGQSSKFSSGTQVTLKFNLPK
jgi:signal transduction histidine kinase